MSRRRQSFAPVAPIDPAVFERQVFGPPRRQRDPADVTHLPAPLEDEWADVLPNAVLLGLVVVLAPLAPFVPLALSVGWRALGGW